MNDKCIFCEIVKGNIPSFTIYEDEMFKVILDRFPATKGHVLILPKQHCKDLFELPEKEATALMGLAQRIGKQLCERLGCTGLNLVQNNGVVAGQTVHHFHLHLVPRYEGEVVVLNQTTHLETTLDELEKVAQALRA